VQQPNIPKPPRDSEASNQDDGKVTPPAAAVAPEAPSILGKEERIEYRDQDGNLLEPSQVSSLAEEGKVTFKTRYETSTKVVDADGVEVLGANNVAPKHPDVEGQNPDTKGKPEEGKSQPADAEINSVGSDHDPQSPEPKPASEANEATGKSKS
jgi:dolichyl-phosphate-mannose-protein mannosyltransferase